MQQVVVRMLPPPLAGDGLEPIPRFSIRFPLYKEVVVQAMPGGERRRFAADWLITIGEMVEIEGRTWRVTNWVDDPLGPARPVYGDCGEVYVDEHEVLLLLG